MKTKIIGLPLKMKYAPKGGEKINDFNFTTTDGRSFDNKKLLGTRYIISTFPSIDTKVCNLQTRSMIARFSNINNTLLFNVSTSSKDRFDKWCAGTGLKANMVSDSKAHFLKKLGLKLPMIKIASRSVIVVDTNGVAQYVEITKSVSDEPDYSKLYESLEQ